MKWTCQRQMKLYRKCVTIITKTDQKQNKNSLNSLQKLNLIHQLILSQINHLHYQTDFKIKRSSTNQIKKCNKPNQLYFNQSVRALKQQKM